MTQNKTNIYFDFEFIDDGDRVTPISIGMCTDAMELTATAPDVVAGRRATWYSATSTRSTCSTRPVRVTGCATTCSHIWTRGRALAVWDLGTLA